MKKKTEMELRIIERTKALIKASPLKQADIAKLIECEANAFRQYCTGRTPLPMRYWGAFCAVMGVSVDFLITGREHPVIEAYNRLSERDKPLVDRFLFPDAAVPRPEKEAKKGAA